MSVEELIQNLEACSSHQCQRCTLKLQERQDCKEFLMEYSSEYIREVCERLDDYDEDIT